MTHSEQTALYDRNKAIAVAVAIFVAGFLGTLIGGPLVGLPASLLGGLYVHFAV